MYTEQNFYKQVKGRKVTLYLTNGFQMVGEIIAWDNLTILFRVDDTDQMIYIHAISTVQP